MCARLILMSLTSDEDDRNLSPMKPQLPLEFESGDARHSDVEEKTSGLIDVDRSEKFSR